jgi:hypothetical protein
MVYVLLPGKLRVTDRHSLYVNSSYPFDVIRAYGNFSVSQIGKLMVAGDIPF